MSVWVGINGFERIGRLAFRRIQDVECIEVVAINDLANAKMLAHLRKYETTQGTFQGDIEVHDGAFKVKRFWQAESWRAFLGESLALILFSNVQTFSSRKKRPSFPERRSEESRHFRRFLQNNCLSPMAKALQDKFGIQSGLMTTVHVYTGNQNKCMQTYSGDWLWWRL